MRLGDLVRHAPAFARGLALGLGPTRPKPGRKAARAKSPPRKLAPRPAKPRLQARPKPRPRKAAPLPPFGALDATGFFLAAGLILAWPREGGSNWERARRAVRDKGLSLAILQALAPPGAEAQVLEMADPGHGRDARHPLAIPPGGWRQILLRTWTEINNDRIVAIAGSVTFFGLLAMFPALAAFVSLYGLFFDVHEAREQLRAMSGFVPHDILVFIGDEMMRISQGGSGKLGVTFAVTLLLSLWSANGGVKALFLGLNIAYEERETRGLVKLNLVSLAFTLGALAFAVLAFATVVAAPAVLGFLRLDPSSVWLAELRWPVMLVALAFGLSLVYRYGPSRKHPRWRWITVGGGVAAVLWLVASLAFSFYVANFGHFNKTYGSLGAVVGFMTWLWYSTIIVLVGAELNAEIEHQTAVDTTTGAPRPMGARGARMADTVASAPAPLRKPSDPPPQPAT